jgi:hypothetical protein
VILVVLGTTGLHHVLGQRCRHARLELSDAGSSAEAVRGSSGVITSC